MKKSMLIVAAFALIAITAIKSEAGFGQTVCPVNPCGDVTHDGNVTATDALAVLRKAVGLDANGNPNQPELCEFTQTSKRGNKVRTRVLGDEGEVTPCFTGKPVTRIHQ